MKYRNLGSTGIKVSEIGFGTWGLGGNSYGLVDDRVSQEALRLALDLGITFYDTSDLYGNGHSEEILGRVFGDCRGEVVIASKVGTLPHTGFEMPQDFSAQHIRAGVDTSLRRLSTEYIDLYQLHSPPMELSNWDEVISTMESLRQEGKIRAWGVSARSPSDAKVVIEQYRCKVIQVNFNLIDQRAADSGLLDLCRRNDVGVIVRTPLCFGFLSGRLTGSEDFKVGDHRANWPRAQLRRWAEAPRLFQPLIEGKQKTLSQLALQFCLSESAVSTVIPGMLTPGEVRDNTAASALRPLAETELSKIRKIYDRNLFYVGRSAPA